MKLDEEKIVEYLRNNMRGYITSYQLVDKTGACDTDLKKLSMEELFKLDEEVFEIGKRNNYLLSKRHHYFEELGMPWNIDFEIIYNDCDYFEDTFGYGSYVRCRGEAMIASDLLKQDEGIYGLIFDLSPDSDGSVKEKTIYVKKNEFELMKPFCADGETVRRLFRLDTSTLELAREGKYPFAVDSESVMINEDDLKCFCERVENADAWTLFAWHKIFADQRYVYTQKNVEPNLTVDTIWDIFTDEFAWYDFEEDDLAFFPSWYKAYETNKGRLLSEMELDVEQKTDFCGYLESISDERYPSAEQIKAFRKYMDELINSGVHWAIERKAWGSYGGNALLECDWKEAERCLLKMYELDINKYSAANALGYIYYSNRLGQADYDKAFKFFSEAAKEKVVQATYKMADMYRKGHGTDKDADKAFKIYKKLYDSEIEDYEEYGFGESIADIALRLGYCYESGEGVEKDLIKARYYFAKADEAIRRRMEHGGAYGDDVVYSNIQKALERTEG
ncbi:MAG: sel1 repeat family protein [Erysipelotrichaceae bacterium]|nr:sel1 repeat family protein [Erysipelotrichaceae bacterium]